MSKNQKRNKHNFIKLDGDMSQLGITTTRQPDSRGGFMCPVCKQRWYFGEQLAGFFADITQEKLINGILPRHKTCNAFMEIVTLPENLPPPVTVADLDRIYFRAPVAQTWGNVNAKDATDEQFDQWITAKLQIEGEPMPWSLEERAAVCDICLQRGELVLIKKDEETK